MRQAPARRWVGTLICRTAGCNTELAEVFADEQHLTYLPQIGGGRVQHIGVPCPKCGAVRRFESVRLPPTAAGSGSASLTPVAEVAYDPKHK